MDKNQIQLLMPRFKKKAGGGELRAKVFTSHPLSPKQKLSIATHQFLLILPSWAESVGSNSNSNGSWTSREGSPAPPPARAKGQK